MQVNLQQTSLAQEDLSVNKSKEQQDYQKFSLQYIENMEPYLKILFLQYLFGQDMSLILQNRYKYLFHSIMHEQVFALQINSL